MVIVRTLWTPRASNFENSRLDVLELVPARLTHDALLEVEEHRPTALGCEVEHPSIRRRELQRWRLLARARISDDELVLSGLACALGTSGTAVAEIEDDA